MIFSYFRMSRSPQCYSGLQADGNSSGAGRSSLLLGAALAGPSHLPQVSREASWDTHPPPSHGQSDTEVLLCVFDLGFATGLSESGAWRLSRSHREGGFFTVLEPPGP